MKLVKLQNPVLTPWPAFARLSDLQDEIDRLFEASSAFSGWTPAIELVENNDSIVVRAELPGMKKDDLEISLHEGILTIAGERKNETKVEEGGVYRSERFFGRFQRSIALPKTVATEKVKAEYKDGVLAVSLPKTEEAKPKQINVSVN